jgi:hypothetical protein
MKLFVLFCNGAITRKKGTFASCAMSNDAVSHHIYFWGEGDTPSPNKTIN